MQTTFNAKAQRSEGAEMSRAKDAKFAKYFLPFATFAGFARPAKPGSGSQNAALSVWLPLGRVAPWRLRALALNFSSMVTAEFAQPL